MLDLKKRERERPKQTNKTKQNKRHHKTHQRRPGCVLGYKFEDSRPPRTHRPGAGGRVIWWRSQSRVSASLFRGGLNVPPAPRGQSSWSALTRPPPTPAGGASWASAGREAASEPGQQSAASRPLLVSGGHWAAPERRPGGCSVTPGPARRSLGTPRTKALARPTMLALRSALRHGAPRWVPEGLGRLVPPRRSPAGRARSHRSRTRPGLGGVLRERPRLRGQRRPRPPRLAGGSHPAPLSELAPPGTTCYRRGSRAPSALGRLRARPKPCSPCTSRVGGISL